RPHTLDQLLTTVCPISFLFFRIRRPLRPTLFPYTTLFRSVPWWTSSGGSWRYPRSCPTSWPSPRRTSPIPATWSISSRRWFRSRSEEHTSELQSPYDLVCRLLLEKKKINILEVRYVSITVI